MLGEADVEQLLKTTIETAVPIESVKKSEFDRVTVDSTAQEKLTRLAKRSGIKLNQTHELRGKSLRRSSAGYGDAKLFKPLKRVLPRQQTLLREVRSKMDSLARAAKAGRETPLQRAEFIQTQQPKEENKL